VSCGFSEFSKITVNYKKITSPENIESLNYAQLPLSLLKGKLGNPGKSSISLSEWDKYYNPSFKN